MLIYQIRNCLGRTRDDTYLTTSQLATQTMDRLMTLAVYQIVYQSKRDYKYEAKS